MKLHHYILIIAALVFILVIMPRMVNIKINKPVDGPITSPFGIRKHPITGAYKFHNGVDIAASVGTPIYAPADGVVVVSNYTSTGGNQLVIKHDLYYTGYAHLNDKSVAIDQNVKKGQVIGHVGKTGAVTGAHLHFTLKALNYTYLDPEKYFI